MPEGEIVELVFTVRARLRLPAGIESRDSGVPGELLLVDTREPHRNALVTGDDLIAPATDECRWCGSSAAYAFFAVESMEVIEP
jgi:hypothetical protein